MNENRNPTRKDAGAAMPASALQIVITWDQLSGAINVQGPMQNSVVCYGMLEAAKAVIQKYIEQNQSPIVRPSELSVVGN